MSGWRLSGSDVPLSGERAADLIRERAGLGVLETWLEHDDGRLLSLTGNGTRALVMLLGDTAEEVWLHAIDPDALGEEDGYVLTNGQHDTYANRDTLPFADALAVVAHIVTHGAPPATTTWAVDA